MRSDAETRNEQDSVVVAILARDKARALPLYLECVLNQTFPKDRTHIYIRANDSSDETSELLMNWVDLHGSSYQSVTADYSDLGGLESYGNHAWDSYRCSVMAQIRQASVDHALRLGCHYFVADLDNFIIPTTLQTLFDTGLPVVAPLLRTVSTAYSNFHHHTDHRGYDLATPEHYALLLGRIKGLILCNLVHCTYFIRRDILGSVRYDDGTGRHEYVMFSDNLRAQSIPQYLDNRQIYGLICFLADSGFDQDDIAVRIGNLSASMPRASHEMPAEGF